VSNGTGATLLDWRAARDVPVPSTEVPRVNYWRHDGTPPASVRSMRLAGFRWRPLVRVRVRPARLAVSPRQDARLRTSAETGASVQLAVHRVRGSRLTRVGTVRRVVAPGAGSLRLSCLVGGRHLKPGRYALGSATAGVMLAPARVRFTVRR
jgi:hypothetical protein